MKHSVQHIIMGLCIIMSALVFSCSDSEPRTGLLGQTSTVIINLGLPDDLAIANPSIIDRIRRFFTKDAIAQTAPATFSTVKVRITASDIGVIEKEFNPYGVISLNVPAGNLRQFEVIATVAPGDPSAAASFRGTVIMNLSAGETVTVPVAMTLNETKVVVVDLSKNRVVQIDSIATGAATWKTDQLGLGTFSPYDIDFDSRGRIYIARNTATDSLIRIDNITSTTYVPIISAGGAIKTIAIDRKNHILYYGTSTNTLNRISCNGGTSTNLPKLGTSPIYNIEGIAFDENENVLYIAGTDDASRATLFKYSLNSSSVIDSYMNTSYLSNTVNNPWHVLVKYPDIYVTSYNGPAGYKLLQFNTSLDLIKGYGSYGTTTAQGSFYGPRRFLAILNRKITIMDDGVTIDKLISMDNFNGDGWITYGSYSGYGNTDPGFFQFYISS